MNKYQKELSSNGLKPKIVKLNGEALYKHLQLYFGKSPKEALQCMIENNQDISFSGGIHFRLGRDKENHDFDEAMNGLYKDYDGDI